nr:alpha/beta hydrolase [uncultured Ralstonia sp.]
MQLARLIIVFVCLAFSACQSTPPDVARTWSLPPGVKVLHVNGYDMAYIERGSGVPVILIPGALVDYRNYAAQMEPFSANYRVISVSLRHYYPEHWNGSGNDFSYQQHAADVAAFIQALNAGPVHLVGHSRGGTVAMLVASAHPELVRSLVVAEGGRGVSAFMPTDPKSAEETKASANVYKRVLERLNQGDVEGGLSIFAAAVNGPRAWEEKYTETVKQLYRDNVWTIKGNANESADAFTCADARRITAPTLLLGAEQSPVIFHLVLDKIKACMNAPEHKVVEHSAHSMHRLNPAGFNQAVLSFLEAH